MSYDLMAEINRRLDALAAQQQAWVPRWITQEICAEHRSAIVGTDDHAAFWNFCGFNYTRKLVTEAVNDRAKGPLAVRTSQLELPGFERGEYLQDYYVVQRDGEDQAVCVVNLTDEEIDDKVALYEKQARAATQHAQELLRFKAWRKARAA